MGSDQRGTKGLSNEGQAQEYGKYPTEAETPSRGYSVIQPESAEAESSLEEEVNPLYINETEQAQTKRPTKTTEKPTTTNDRPIKTTERPTTTTTKKLTTTEEATTSSKIVSVMLYSRALH